MAVVALIRQMLATEALVAEGAEALNMPRMVMVVVLQEIMDKVIWFTRQDQVEQIQAVVEEEELMMVLLKSGELMVGQEL